MPAWPFYSGVFLVAATMLMQQVIHTRILSVVTWYYFAFLLISLAMFGLSAGAVWVHRRAATYTTDTLGDDLAHFANAAAATTLFALFIEITFINSPGFSLRLAFLALSLTLPFFFSGIAVCLFLTRSPFPVSRVYGVDMGGAAVGCLGALGLLNSVSGPAALLWSAVLLSLAGVAFSFCASGREQRRRPFSEILTPWVLLPLLGTLATVASAMPWTVPILFPKGHPESSRGLKLFEDWNSLSRIAVYDYGTRTPLLWGPATDAPLDKAVRHRLTQIDGLAGTFAYERSDDLSFLGYDVTNFAYHLPRLRRAVVVGVGAGRDILSAKLFGVEVVVGLEINPILLRLLLDEKGFSDFSNVKGQPGVQLFEDEGRSWLATSQDSFDIIQMSLIDTWAATGAGAFALSENKLYTVDAWNLFLTRLSADGVISLSRYHVPGVVGETTRLVSTAWALLLDRARDPGDHLFLVASTNTSSPPAVDPVSVSTLLISKLPFSLNAIEKLETAARQRGFDILLRPGTPPTDPVLQMITKAKSTKDLERLSSSMPLDITPATDDRPFFFNQLRILDAIRLRLFGGATSYQVSGNLQATSTLLGLCILSAILVIATILVPLRGSVRHGESRLVLGGTSYFAAIGVGFMAVEIGLIQRMSVFLGHPAYSLSIVLFSLIAATALGSFLSDRYSLVSRLQIVVWAALTGTYMMLMPMFLPALTHKLAYLPLVGRMGVCVAVIVPVGVLMGYALPTGMREVSNVSARPLPWFWGVNGAAGVLTASLAILCSIAYGINVTLWLGAVCYLILIPAFLMIRRASIG